MFCDFYLPGFRSGGGMWTVVNLVERFRDRFEFYIVTRNHDGRSDPKPYDSVESDEWNSVGGARVFYASGRNLNTRAAACIAAQVAPEIVFLNSVFSTPVLSFLNARRKGLIEPVPVVLAPCGELSEAALGFKYLKKKGFLKYARVFGLYDGLVWKATSELEEAEIRNQIGNSSEILMAPDLAPKTILPDLSLSEKPQKEPGKVKLCFVSRLTRKKNLLYLLQRLGDIDEESVELEIIGPVEDRGYWNDCESAIKSLPPNVSISASGAMPQTDILKRLVASHFFVLPTLNENFGYVFVEAMAAGCPLIISDRTVWNEIAAAGIGWTTPLDDPRAWLSRIREAAGMDADTFSPMSRRAREYAVEWLSRSEHDIATARVLERALHGVESPISASRRKPAIP